MGPGHAHAADAVAADAEVHGVEELVVTGNRAQSTTAIKSPAPVNVVAGADLERLGANTNLRDALAQLLPSFQAQTVSSSSWNSLSRPAGLRGFGGAHVLVLVNGKRRHSSALIDLSSGSPDPGASPVDLDLIPVSAVDRIEVLRDGAAAQYGSDAIAGVINVILKSNSSGGDVTLNAGQRYPWHGKTDGQNSEVGASVGFGLPNDGSVTFGLDAKDQRHARRSVAATGAFYYPVNGAPDPREATVNKVVYAGGLPDAQTVTGSYNAILPINDGLSLYSFGTVSDRSAVIGQNFRRPNSTNAVLSIFPDGYAPNYTLDETDFQVAVGAKGNLGAWRWDASSTLGRDDTRNGSTNTVNASLGASSPTSFWTFSAAFEQWTNNLDLSRDISIGLAEPLHVSIGAEHRYENYKTTSGDPLAYANGGYIYPTGPLAGQRATVGAQGAITLIPSDATEISRNSYAAYVDLGLNPTEKWFVAVAGRAEHYDDSAGDTVSGKLTTRYDFSPYFAVRATISNGFRAPSLSQEAYAQTSNQYSLVNGVSAFVQSKSVTFNSPLGVALGAKPLKPETSTNYSLGFTATTGSKFDATLDIYQIELKDRIVQTGFLNGAGVNAILAANGFQQGLSIRYFANAIDTRTQGFDLVANYHQNLDAFGDLHLSLGFNHNEVKITKIAASPAQLTGLNLTLFDRGSQGGLTVAYPKDKLILGQAWSYERLRVSLRETYYGGVKYLNNNPTFDQTYGAKWISDLDVSYDVNDKINVSVGVNNLTNQYPDRNTVVDTNGFTPYSSVSPFGYYGGYYYGRVSYKF